MKVARLGTAFLALALTLLVGRVEAAGKWSLKKFVPSLSKKDEVPKGLYPPAEQPSMLQRMNNGTKTALAKTKQAIPPWLMPGTQERVRKSSDSLKSSSDRMRGEVREARRSFFAPWADSTEKQEEKPSTVSDWLGQKRPE